MDINSTPELIQWNTPKRIGLRFFFIFFLLFSLFIPDDIMQVYGGAINPFLHLFQNIVSWIAMHVFYIAKPLVLDGLGSDDTTFNYLLCGLFILIAALVAYVWFYVRRKATNDDKLLYWTMAMLRYFLALTMLFFGFSKLFDIQFPELSINTLMKPVGDMSPMGLIWTFMEYSRGFVYFTGLSEALCAILLFFRKTTRLGATIGFVVLLNIAAINFCYDVCLKLSSTILLLMCLFILLPDFKRFINFFFYDRVHSPTSVAPHRFKAKWKNDTLKAAKYLLILYIIAWNYNFLKSEIVEYHLDAKNPPLYGLYQVETFVRKRDTVLPLTTDTNRWNKFWISQRGAVVKLMNDSLKSYFFKPNTAKHLIELSAYTDTSKKFYFHYKENADILEFYGKWQGDSVNVKMRKKDLNKFRLTSRGFHMVNEMPYAK